MRSSQYSSVCAPSNPLSLPCAPPLLIRIPAVLKLNGVNAKEHPIFTELTRVKQYFEKIKEAEDGGPEKRKNMKLNAPAANRFIKHALAGNDKYDKKRAEQQMQEQQRAKRKLDEIEGPNETTSEPTSIHQKTVTDLSASSSQPNTRGATADPEEISSSTKSTAPALPEQDAARKERKRARREQRKEEGNHKNHSKKKSSKPPKDSKTVFQSLLKRGAEG